MHIELAKLANNAQKSFNLFKQQMQREGHTKRESLQPENIKPETLSQTSLALWNEYVKDQIALDNEAMTPSQAAMDLGHTSTTQPRASSNAQTVVANKAGVVRSIYEKLSAEAELIEVSAGTYTQICVNVHAEKLQTSRPTVNNPVSLDDGTGRRFVVIATISADELEDAAFMRELVPLNEWKGEFKKKLESGDTDYVGLGVVSQKEKFVVGDKVFKATPINTMQDVVADAMDGQPKEVTFEGDQAEAEGDQVPDLQVAQGGKS